MEACEPGFILLIVKILIAKISYPFIQVVYAVWMNVYGESILLCKRGVDRVFKEEKRRKCKI